MGLILNGAAQHKQPILSRRSKRAFNQFAKLVFELGVRYWLFCAADGMLNKHFMTPSMESAPNSIVHPNPIVPASALEIAGATQ